jgi:hypothetical protein
MAMIVKWFDRWFTITRQALFGDEAAKLKVVELSGKHLVNLVKCSVAVMGPSAFICLIGVYRRITISEVISVPCKQLYCTLLQAPMQSMCGVNTHRRKE